MSILHVADIVLTLLHLVIIIFNLTGWIWRKTRKIHLVVVALTFGSWFILGIFYGWGYCFLTDWQWRVKEKLGEMDLPDSFIKYIVDTSFGTDMDAGLINNLTLIIFLLILLVTLYVNFFSKK